jgi:hypothetical protein
VGENSNGSVPNSSVILTGAASAITSLQYLDDRYRRLYTNAEQVFLSKSTTRLLDGLDVHLTVPRLRR